MRYLMIQNKNEVDPRGFTLFGASVKEGDDAIGMFGSGTKYSLATLMRHDIVPRIFSGTTEIVIGKVAGKFRGQDFDIITINGAETGITTATGKKWRVDQCVREFYSNAMDEGEAEAAFTTGVFGIEGTTRVFIPAPVGSVPAEMMKEWHKYFIDKSFAAIADSGTGEKLFSIEATGNTPSIMRRGVWCVEDWGSLEALFSYDLKDINLPETRLTSARSAAFYAGYVLRHLTDKASINMILDEAENTESFEWCALQTVGTKPRIEFCDHVKSRFMYVATARDLEYFPRSLRPQILLACELSFRLLKEMGLKDIYEYRNSDDLYFEMSWPIGYMDRANAVVNKLKKNGIDMTFPIKFVRFPGEPEMIAKADMRAKVCLLTQKAFEDERDFMLTKALIEEWTHLRHDVRDGSTEQQHVYLAAIVNLLK